MKLKYIIGLMFAALFALTSCDDNERESLDLSGDVQITSFKLNGVDGTIDEAKKKIKVMMPLGSDLTNLTPAIVASDRAVLSPASGVAQNFTSPIEYRVTNGNLLAKYSVSAEIISAKITKFNIGKYIGAIDDIAKTISLVMPLDADVTALVPTVEYTSGAVLSPLATEAIDFTNPVTYTLTYMGGSFPYVVSIEKKDNRFVAFVGTANSVEEITELDEQTAVQWLLANVQNSSYVSFNSIKSGAVDLKNFSLVWWHCDGDSKELPAIAKEQAVIDLFKAYYQQGGSLFLSSWAVRYVADLGIPGDGREANNMWGDGNNPFQIGDDWGLCFKGNESHPIFQGLSVWPTNASKVTLLSKGVMAKAHNALWNFEWGDYANNIPGWTSSTGAINLASFHWDDNATGRSVMWEYPKVDGGKGGVVCIGVESYDWYHENNSDENSYLTNIQKLTRNTISYLIE